MAIKDLADNSYNQNFQYDSLNRLTQASSASYGISNTITYNYNQIGNMTYNSQMGMYSYGGPGPHAVTQAGSNAYQYDANGNMTSRTGYAIAYDYDNRAVTLNGANGAVQSVYDYTGQRVEKIAPIGTTVYMGKLYSCMNGACTKYIFAGLSRIAVVSPSGTYFYNDDHLGSSSVITDQNGNDVEDIHYYPLGQVLSKTGSVDVKHKYTGQEEDLETGLDYFNARYYDPALGRFISADIYVQSPFDPQALNRYSYVENNPIIYIDPTGHFTWKHPFRHPFSGVGKFFNTKTLIEVAITAVAFYAAGQFIFLEKITAPFDQAFIHTFAGAISGVASGAVSGGNMGKSGLIGAVSAGSSEYAGHFIPQGFGYQLGGQSLVGGVTGGLASEISGNGFEKGFTSGAEIGAAGDLFNDMLHLHMDEGQGGGSTFTPSYYLGNENKFI